MARTFHDVIHEVETYLKRINIPIRDLSVSYEDIRVHTNRYGLDRIYLVRFVLDCNADNFQYFQNIAKDIKIVEVPVYSELAIQQASTWDLSHKQATTRERHFHVMIEIGVIGEGDAQQFMSELKRETVPLFEAAESARFDQEVEKMLKEEDEYNS